MDRSPTVNDRPPKRTRELDVLVGVEKDREDKAAIVEQYVPGQAKVAYENADLSYVTVRFPEEVADRARENFLSAVTTKNGIRYAERNTTLALGYTPSDPQFSDQTAAKMVNAPAAWDVTTGSPDVTIAILDQGVMYDHSDLNANMDGSVTNYGKDFVSDDSDPYPVDDTKEFHGTHVAGIAAAEIDNSKGVAGISQSSILSGRVADENHLATAADVADGVSWATNRGVDIINLSLSGDANPVLKDAVEYAYRNGVLIVAAAGNTSGGAVQYPAAYDECVSVSALTPDGNVAPFSSVGSEVELTAPGMAVVSTTTTDGYGMYSGTSMAAPVVSGVAALAKSKFSLSNDELRAHLKDTAVDVGLAAQEQGFGRVDAREAVTTTSDVTIVDDFEDGDLSEYIFDRGSSGVSVVSSPAYSGSQALEISGDNTEMISTSGLSTYPSAGNTFSYWIRATGGADDVNLTYGVQDHDNRYFVRVDFANDDLMLFTYKSASSDKLDGVDPSLSEDEWYEVEVDWGTNGGHTVTLYDSAGAQLGRVTGSDSTWTSGGIGYDGYLGSSSGSAYFDYVTIGSTGGGSNDQSTIEDFKDGDLAEYAFDQGSSGASVVSSPTYSGSQALEIAGTYTKMISTSGLPTYPSAGDTFSCWMRLDSGTENANFTYGVQNHDNRYYVKLNSEQDGWWLFRYEDGSGTTLAGESAIGLSADTWYEIEVEWRTGGDHIVTLTDASGSVLSQVVGTDSTWTDGGIGFDAYLSSSETVYFDAVTKDTSGGSRQELSLVDGFEDGDLIEYKNASSTDWSAQNSFAFDGSYAAANASNAETIYNNSHTYSRSDEIELRAYLGTANGVSTGLEYWFCTNTDATKKYVHYVSAEENEQYLTYRNGIDQTVIDSTDVEVPSDEWLRLKVYSDEKTLTAEVYDAAGRLLSSVSGTEESLTSGGYGFKDEWRKEGPVVYVDTIRG
jgi:serine protease